MAFIKTEVDTCDLTKSEEDITIDEFLQIVSSNESNEDISVELLQHNGIFNCSRDKTKEGYPGTNSTYASSALINSDTGPRAWDLNYEHSHQPYHQSEYSPVLQIEQLAGKNENFKASNSGDQENHFKMDFKESTFECNICRKNFPSVQQLEIHFLEYYRENKDPQSSPRSETVQSTNNGDHGDHLEESSFDCHFCRTSLTVIEQLELHLTHYQGENCHHCTVCEKADSARGTLIHVKKSDPNERPFECSTNGKICKPLGGLKVHERCDAEDKTFECAVCRMRFIYASVLKDHEMVHLKEKPFRCQCSVCGKRFYWPSLLKRHAIVHTREKPFQCNICYKVFSYKGNLNLHVKRHTGEKQFECEIVQKAFHLKNVF